MVIFQVRDDSDLEQGYGCAGGVKNRKQMFGKINQVIFFCKNGLDMRDEGERSVNDDSLISGLRKLFHEGTIY